MMARLFGFAQLNSFDLAGLKIDIKSCYQICSRTRTGVHDGLQNYVLETGNAEIQRI